LRYPAGGLGAAGVAEVRRIKARVEAERLPRGADRSTHLKLGSGGLADVEWTVQLLQLRHGHDHPGLRTAQTLPALEAAIDDELISRADATELAAAWRSASKIRNAAMLVRGRPSDSLPAQAADRRGVAFLCGYAVDDAGRLSEDYRRVARRAKGAVDRVFWA
ncbi:MAG: bifunctional glutamine-synthetase adenylyltransferase/deadenyltransferase, partial [Nocardioidaceae bacterium]